MRGDFDVQTATSAPEALRHFLDGESFSVLVTDIDMPGVNGFQLLDQVHKHSPRTCRIILTGKPNVDTASKLLSDGLVFRYIVKPCPAFKLREVIREGVAQYEQAISRSRHCDTSMTTSRSVRQAQITRLKHGDELASSVMDKAGHVLVSSGTVIDAVILKKLNKLASEGRIGGTLTIYGGH